MAQRGTYSANQTHVYETNSKQILVTRDPVYNHPAVHIGRNGEVIIVGQQPPTYLPLAVVLVIFNPILGPIALMFSCKLFTILNILLNLAI